MKALALLLSFLLLILLASPVVLLKGCGGEMCGGCPSDSIAPAGSEVIITHSLKDATVYEGTWCTNDVTFVFRDSNGNVLNGICVEIFTNGFIRLSSRERDCYVPGGYVTYIRTRTDAGGTIKVDFSSGQLLCGRATDDIEYNFFVQVSSCTAGNVSEAKWTLDCTQ